MAMAASIRGPVCRHLTAASSPHLRRRLIPIQRRWAQVHDVRFLTTHNVTPQAILDKYRDKLDSKAKREGHESVDALRAAYADEILAQRKKGAVDPAIDQFIPQAPETPVSQPNRAPPATPEGQEQQQGETFIPQAPDTPVAQPNRAPPTTSEEQQREAARKTAKSGEKPAVKTLDEILDLDKVRELPEKEITAIWRLRHAASPSKLCAVIPADTYAAMEELARRAPQFVLPVPHETQGAEMHFLQWVFDRASRTSTVLFTQLAEYKTRGEFAQPHTTITHHLDLAADKGLVLMQGQLMDDRGGVKPEHAKWLAMCLQRFYGAWEAGVELDGERRERAQARKQLLEWFAAGDERFSVEKLLEEAERMG
ncbi:atp11 [Akanthomyces lecanii RCEF 1005]|uniref:Atp11 n=1 Tax=Akanthomyces lecanii RCEF 1005 TaxID=1081108 RepID=A0A168J6H9_CORDF|nr:atp11 [Akanthomyces lecanii RCEF 1005]